MKIKQLLKEYNNEIVHFSDSRHGFMRVTFRLQDKDINFDILDLMDKLRDKHLVDKDIYVQKVDEVKKLMNEKYTEFTKEVAKLTETFDTIVNSKVLKLEHELNEMFKDF